MFVATEGTSGGSGGSDPRMGPSPSASAVEDVEVPLAEVIGLINASTGRLVQLVAQALETGVWAQAGIRSPEHWGVERRCLAGPGPQARHAGEALPRPAGHHRRIPIKLGCRQRTFSAQQRILIEGRYGGGCARPGCQRRRGLHLHHHQHWEDGGLSDFDNAFPLCGTDHRLHHRGLLGVTGDPARPESLVFTDHHGRVLARGAEPSPPDESLPLAETGQRLGVGPAAWRHPLGERLDRWSIWFEDPPSAA